MMATRAVTVGLVIRALLLGAAFAAATLALGWWGVPAAAALWGAMAGGRRGAAAAAALGGAIAWGALLARASFDAPLASLAATLGGVMRIPGPVLVAVTVLYPALLAWAAATVTAALPRRRRA